RALGQGVTEAGERYLVMEWLEGVDLGARLAAGPLSLGDAVRVAVQVAGALGAAHAIGIVHRDVKPANVFLEGGDPSRVRLLDFGVARLMAETSLTGTGMMIGTAGYMA